MNFLITLSKYLLCLYMHSFLQVNEDLCHGALSISIAHHVLCFLQVLNCLNKFQFCLDFDMERLRTCKCIASEYVFAFQQLVMLMSKMHHQWRHYLYQSCYWYQSSQRHMFIPLHIFQLYISYLIYHILKCFDHYGCGIKILENPIYQCWAGLTKW